MTEPGVGEATNSNSNADGTTANYGESTYGTRLNYSQPKWNDVWAAILFDAHIIFIIVLMAVNLSAISGNSSSSSSTSTSTSGLGYVILVASCAAIVGLIFSIIWMKIMERFAEVIIKALLFLNLLMWLVVAVVGVIFMLANPDSSFGIVFIVFGAIFFLVFGIYTCVVWSLIPFSSLLLGISSKIATAYEGTIYVAIICALLQFVWYEIWAVTYIATYISYDNNGEEMASWETFLFLVSFYWGYQVFKNVSHTTTCGVAGTWYFTVDGAVRNPSKPALTRALTTSFGSICFGSLIVAILSATRTMLRMAGRNILARCIIACIECIMRYFNTYAFAQVAIYGVSYWAAARATWELFLAKGFHAIINDDLTGLAITCGAIIGLVLSTVVGVLMTLATIDDLVLQIWAIIFSVLAGYCTTVVVLSVVRSGIVALFVCFCEDPASFATSHSQEYQKFIGAKPGLQAVANGGTAGEVAQEQQSAQ